MFTGMSRPSSAAARKKLDARSTLPGRSEIPAMRNVAFVAPFGWQLWQEMPSSRARLPSTRGEWKSRSPSRRSLTADARSGE